MPKTQELANAIRFLAIDMVEQAKSGHPGMPMGMADVITILFRDFIKFMPQDSHWPDRDRFILSAGHGSALLYAVLYLTGYDMQIEDLKHFRKLGSRTPGHPEYGHTGIETTTGPLAQGLANAVGMALAERILNAQYTDAMVSHKTYVVVGDGCLMEGLSQEAISFAGHLRLKHFIVLFDDNGISIDGSTNLATSDDHLARFAASGWQVRVVDGHNYTDIHDALTWAQSAEHPVLLACKTQIAYGSPNKGGSCHAHGSPLGAQEVLHTRQYLKWPYPPFVIPDDILSTWRNFFQRNISAYETWQKQPSKESFLARLEADFYTTNINSLLAFKQQLSEHPVVEEATRRSSQRILSQLIPLIPSLIGGSADLTPSNNTKTEMQKPISAENYGGQYIHYGIREHAMGGIMNGLALHGGFIPYGGTFLAFTDYMRPAIRLAALMRQRVIYVMTHDSIGLGEDGPTHQPIEHLVALRAIPHLQVFRPCDAVETLEAWELALQYQGPSILALTRQNLPQVRLRYAALNMVQYGAYILRHTEGAPDVTIFASGSEVHLAFEVADILEMKVRVISAPQLQLFAKQTCEYRDTILQNSGMKVVIEAALLTGWQDVLGPVDLLVGLHDFGASAPADDLYQHFGLTAEAISAKILKSKGLG